MVSVDDRRQVLYPPTVIGHIVKDIADLFRRRARGMMRIEVHFGYQLNGPPHIGTATSLMCAFATASHLSRAFGIPSSVVFGGWENVPGDKIEDEGIQYQRMLCDTIREGRPLSESYLDHFSALLDRLTQLTGVSHRVTTYAQLQAAPTARRALLRMLDREDEFVPILNPSDDRLRVRFPCPRCRLQDKHAKTLRILECRPSRCVLESRCWEHGPHRIVLEETSGDFVDVNSMVRNVMKEALIAEDSARDKTLPVIAKGADWTYAAVLVSTALEMLGYADAARPCRIGTPMVEDWSGAKLSKSLYVSEDAYDGVPQDLVSMESFEQAHGDQGFRRLYHIVASWVEDPRKLFRNYSLEYFASLFPRTSTGA